MYCRQNEEGETTVPAGTIALLPLWMFLFIAVGFGLMVKGFADTCTYGIYYGDKLNNPTLATTPNATSFAHAECAKEVLMWRIWKTTPQVAMGILGGCFASCSSLAITSMGMLVGWLRGKLSSEKGEERAEKSGFILSLSGICIDLMDWQDFTLTLIDGEFLEGAAEAKANKSWKCVLAWCAVSFLVITCILVFEFTHAIWKIDPEPEEGEAAEELVEEGQKTKAENKNKGPKLFSPGEWYCVAASLFFIEIPFLAFRTYATLRFSVVPSSLILKNMVSVPKKIYELYVGRSVATAVTGAAGAD